MKELLPQRRPGCEIVKKQIVRQYNADGLLFLMEDLKEVAAKSALVKEACNFR